MGFPSTLDPKIKTLKRFGLVKASQDLFVGAEALGSGFWGGITLLLHKNYQREKLW